MIEFQNSEKRDFFKKNKNSMPINIKYINR